MKTIEGIKNKLTEIKPFIREKYKVKKIAIFGSYVKRENKKGSDLDILVEFEEGASITLLYFIEINGNIFKQKIGYKDRFGRKESIKTVHWKNYIKRGNLFMKHEVKDYINDIIESMQNALNFISEMDYEEFITDTKTVYAVIRALEIIGESVKKIPKEIRNKYPKIPWKKMAAMRDKLIHEYFGVIYERVWETLKKDIPEIKTSYGESLTRIKR